MHSCKIGNVLSRTMPQVLKPVLRRQMLGKLRASTNNIMKNMSRHSIREKRLIGN